MSDFTPESVRRIEDAVLWVERVGRGLAKAEPRGRHLATPEVLIARVTSGTPDGDGFYDAVLTRYDAAADTWDDFATVKLLAVNGEALTDEARYGVRPAGYASGGEPLYVVLNAARAGAIPATVAYAADVNLVTTATVVNTTTEGSLFTTSALAHMDDLTKGPCVRVFAGGLFSKDIGSTPTIRFRLRLSNTAGTPNLALYDTGAYTLPGASNFFRWALQGMIRWEEAGGTIGTGWFNFQIVAQFFGGLVVADAQSANVDVSGGSPTFDMTAQWGTANANNTATGTLMVVDVANRF